MTVEKKEVEVDALGITNKKRKTSVWESQDGETFIFKKDADKHDKRVIALDGFKMYFSAEKENLKTGSSALNEIVLPLIEGNGFSYQDCFWIKMVDTTEDAKVLKIFCTQFYKASLGDRLSKEDEYSYVGWIYVVIVDNHSKANNYWRWISLSTLRKRLKIMENSFPDNDNSIGQLEDNDCLLDLD